MFKENSIISLKEEDDTQEFFLRYLLFIPMPPESDK